MTMKNIFRLLCLLLCLSLCAPALALEPLPMDSDVGGYPWKDENVLDKYEYRDESIHVKLEKVKHEGVWMILAHVTISDPSQIRTAASYGRYDDQRYVQPKLIAKSVNAVLAMNGDFFKYHDFGYLVRQGQVLRKNPDGNHDVLLIDNFGDFHVVPRGTMETIQAVIDALPEGHHVVNSFNFGPILVLDGVAQDTTYKYYQPGERQQRMAIVQTGELSYVVVQAAGKVDGSHGFTMRRFADAIAQLIPDAKVAFNMDGGGSSYVILMDRKINDNDGARSICDILYFASLVP